LVLQTENAKRFAGDETLPHPKPLATADPAGPMGDPMTGKCVTLGCLVRSAGIPRLFI
jgi:hypothetical protein